MVAGCGRGDQAAAHGAAAAATAFWREPSCEMKAKEELRDWLRSISPTFTCYFQIMEENYAPA